MLVYTSFSKMIVCVRVRVRLCPCIVYSMHANARTNRMSSNQHKCDDAEHIELN